MTHQQTGGWRRTVLAPGDGLRQWWSELGRPGKWIFGAVLFLLLGLLPLYTPPGFLDTPPGISFGGTMAQFAMIAIIAIGLNVVVGQAGLLDLATSVSMPSAPTRSRCSPARTVRGTRSVRTGSSARTGPGCPVSRSPWR